MDSNADLNKKFWDVLLFYSNSKTKDVAKEEWTALSKDANLCDFHGGLSEELIEHYEIKKLPPRKNNCICTHRIVKNKFIFNMFNRNILTVGSHCIRRYLSYTTKKLCLECKTPFIPKDRKGRRYCQPCKQKWCLERGYRGYRYGRFHYKSMRQTGRSMSAMPNERRELEFCSTGTSMSYNPGATLNRNRQQEFFGCVSSKSYDPSATLNKQQQLESRRCDSGESSNPKAMTIKVEHQWQFRGHGLSHSLTTNNNLSKIVNLNLITQVKSLKFSNKAILFQYLASQEYIEGTKKINFGPYSDKKLKDFNDPSYYNSFTKNDLKLDEGKQLNDEKLAFYFYVSYINKKN